MLTKCGPVGVVFIVDERHAGDRVLGRGGWVGVRNYELDSGGFVCF